MDPISQKNLNIVGCRLVAKALITACPHVQLIHCIGEQSGFTLRFESHLELDPSLKDVLSVNLKKEIEKGESIISVEMPLKLAKNLLKKQKQFLRLDVLDDIGGNVAPIIQIGDFADYCIPIPNSFAHQFEHYTLLTFEKLDGYYEIKGSFFSSFQEKSVKLKALKKLLKYSAKNIVEKQDLGLVVEDQIVFLKPLLEMKEHFKSTYVNYLINLGYNEIASYGDVDTDQLSVHIKSGLKKIFQFYMNEDNESVDFISSLIEPSKVQKELISYLQFFFELIRILGFSYSLELYRSKEVAKKDEKYWLSALKECECFFEIVGAGPEISDSILQFKLKDQYQREHIGPKISLVSLNEGVYVRASFFNSLEKMVLLFLEQHEGKKHKI